jgi:hypothetical protein
MFIVFSKNLLPPFAKVKKNVKDYFLVGVWMKVSGRQSFFVWIKILSGVNLLRYDLAFYFWFKPSLEANF